MKRRSLLLILFLLTWQFAQAYPIDPRPLRKLIMESTYIVIGHVEKIETVKEAGGKRDNRWTSDNTFAILRIIEVLQGEIVEKTIRISFHANFICPAPDRYFPGTDVVVFLEKTDDGNYRVPALSYGAKTLPKEGIDTYKVRIREMQQILAIPEKDKQFFETVEWLVRCAENPVTRWEGTYELSPQSDFMSYYARSEHEPYALLLTEEHKVKLKASLLQQKKFSYDDIGLIDIVYMGVKDEVYTLMVNQLRSIEDDELWFAAEIMERLTYVNDDPNLKEHIKKYEEAIYSLNGRDQAEAKRLVDKFLKEIQ